MAMTTPSFIPTPWASEGQKDVIPESQADSGRATWKVGFPPETAIPRQSGGIPPNRMDFQGVFNALSEHTFFQQSGSLYTWNASLNYLKGAHILGSNGVEYVAQQNSGPGYDSGAKNPTKDTTHTYWKSQDLVWTDKIYPVGSIYLSMSNTNPKLLFGGTWKQLGGRFLIGANNSYTVGATGGNADHTLTSNEMPIHTHTATVSEVAAHTHTATVGTVAAHSHNISVTSNGNHAHTATVGTVAAHSHDISVTSNGNHTHTATVGTVAAHSHDVTVDKAGGHTHTATVGIVSDHAHKVTVEKAGSHTHTATVGTVASHTHTTTIGNSGGHTHTATTSSTGTHSHTRGTMEIKGGGLWWENSEYEEERSQVTGAFYVNAGVNNACGSSKTDHDNNQVDFLASRAWTGSTSSTGAHTHSLTTSNNGAHSHTATSAANGGHTHTVTNSNVADHTHGATCASAGGHTHTVTNANNGSHTHTATSVANGSHTHTVTNASNGKHSHTVTNANAGGGAAFSVLPPYLVCYMWQRTA